MKFLYSLALVVVLFMVASEADRICGPGGVFNSCDSPCRRLATCANPEPGHGATNCPAICEPRCVCTSGYVWHNGHCMSRAQCPSHHQH